MRQKNGRQKAAEKKSSYEKALARLKPHFTPVEAAKLERGMLSFDQAESRLTDEAMGKAVEMLPEIPGYESPVVTRETGGAKKMDVSDADFQALIALESALDLKGLASVAHWGSGIRIMFPYQTADGRTVKLEADWKRSRKVADEEEDED